MKALIALTAFLPTAALADIECTLARQCGGGTCETFTGGPMLLHDAGDGAWQVSLGGQTYQGYLSADVAEGGEIAITIPPQAGMSGFVSVFPAGEVAFTAHALGDGEVIAITGAGTCSGVGG
ncbi:hypothetical protein [Tabrizicola sp. BL-A-41-H6]|uniref:hypothetical protein n=1 Tax=Tabrizicola sp. BL-A-41-H6 TaxID=3421107 RepID=UPI003D67EFC2